MNEFRAIVVDDAQDFRADLDGFLRSDFPISLVEHTNDREEAEDFSPGANFIILDCIDGRGGSYWNDLLPTMRTKHAAAYIVLLTQYEDSEVKKYIKNSAAEHVLETDPMLDFVSKGEGGKLDDGCRKRFNAVLSKFVDQINKRRELEATLVGCTLGSAKEILASKIEDLIVKTVSSKDKSETYNMDVVAERAIADAFGPFVHSHDILICTEERGAHNRLHHRIMSPRFYIFSDPFDGSSRTKVFLEQLCGAGRGKVALCAIVEDVNCMKNWEKDHGNKSLNSPMVSVVLAERHRVVAAVLVNLFTYDIFIAVEAGIFYYSKDDFSCNSLRDVKKRLRAGECLDNVNGWERLKFRPLRQSVERDLAEGNVGHFLCTLQARKVRKGDASPYYSHANACIRPLLPSAFRWQESFTLRYEQNDFTPGPGRILFLLNSRPTNKYDKESLNGGRYECVLSAGEPLTEWIGWFAFLRHSSGITAYCLRRNGSPLSGCPHRKNPTDHAALLPDAILSIFRRGHMDLSLLPVAYGRAMRNYHDTILIVYDDDPDWSRVFEGVEEDDCFVRIPTF
ncbi:MAG: hypothetical protein GY835_03655 [bacterium]|nr:hypothetical protein [bacterium]